MIYSGHLQLQKYPGKGGWTYAAIPAFTNDSTKPFGMVRVAGSIDHYQFQYFHLMPMGDGKLFLPVKKEVRRLIQKQAGDTVWVSLYLDNSPIIVPSDLSLCLDDEPMLRNRFDQWPPHKKLQEVKHIEAAKTDSTRIKRITQLIDKLYLETDK